MSDERQWHKASYSGGSGSCVEVSAGQEVLVRDTQNRDLGYLGFPAAEWTDLMSTVRVKA